LLACGVGMVLDQQDRQLPVPGSTRAAGRIWHPHRAR
jgi:hypothetical protein